MIVALITMSLATLRTVLYEKKARMLRQGRLRRRLLHQISTLEKVISQSYSSIIN